MFVDEKKMLIDFFGGGCVNTGPVRMQYIKKEQDENKKKLQHC